MSGFHHIIRDEARELSRSLSGPSKIAPLLFTAIVLGACVGQQPALGIAENAQLSSVQNAEDIPLAGTEGAEPLAGETQVAAAPEAEGIAVNALPVRAPRAGNNATATTSPNVLAIANPEENAPKNNILKTAVAEPVANAEPQPTTVAALAPKVSDASATNQKRSLRSFFQRKPRKKKAPRPARRVASVRSRSGNVGGNALPGVKSNAELFGIQEAQEGNRATMVASVGGFGRLSPNGLRIQHEGVKVACLKPGVLRILKIVEKRYRSKPIITSGYRSPKGNRRAGGARNSQHIFCKAVDIQVEGVSKWDLAKFLRTVPGRGGVGTYCRTKSVHVDIGSKRDWHHPCRRSSVRKRKRT